MYLPVYTQRHFEPVRKCEFSDNTTDAFKISVEGGLWHLGNRTASAADTELTIASSSTKAIYAHYVKSGYSDSVTISQGDVSTVMALLIGSDGYLYHLLATVVSDGYEVNNIFDAWEGGDIISADINTVNLDEHSLEWDSTHYSDTKAAMYGFDHGNPSTSGDLVTGDIIPVAQGSDDTVLLWKTLPAYSLSTHNHDGTYAFTSHYHAHTWYYDASWHTDGPTSTHADNTYLRWNGTALEWVDADTIVAAGDKNHYDLADIVPGTYNKYDHIGHWQNPAMITGRCGAPDISYLTNAGSSIGDSSYYLAIDLDNRRLTAGPWYLNENSRRVDLGISTGGSDYCAVQAVDGTRQVRLADGYSAVYATDGTYSAYLAGAVLGCAGRFYGGMGNWADLAGGTYCIDSGGLGINVGGGGYYYSAVKVVGAQGSAIADIADTTGTDNDGTCRSKVNSILAMLRTHGLIAT